MAAGAGMVVSRAVVRDLFPPDEAQRVMSQVTIFFGVAPAVAPIVGGWLFVHLGWHAVFWFLAAVGGVLGLVTWRALPETLAAAQRQRFDLPNLVRGYSQLGLDRRFWLLALASGVPFNGLFLYVLSTPVFLGEHLKLGPTQFGWFFVTNIAGVMVGAWVSGRLAGRMAPTRQVALGFAITALASLANVVGNLIWAAALPWAFVPLTAYAFGWALLVPVVTLMLLDLYPARRGLASSLQASIGSTANALVAGVLVPWVMHDTRAMAIASALLLGVGLSAWLAVRHEVRG
jgi:DHA1 family bicyclomycin/chloramphenicol resistance-like MFS transporter